MALWGTLSIAQDAATNKDIEMADGLRSSGKIYVVVLVVCILFTGLFVYLFFVDSRLRKLEDEVKQGSDE